jgi:acyl-coenzyme A synthetase/AMP-(fatty) acid ligase
MEGGWPISVLDPGDHAAIADGDTRLATSCGRPVEQVKVRLRPTNGEAMGELLVASDMTVEEYKGTDGYCSLGDLMDSDEQGYLFFRGRLDRMINTGYHVYPAEIEEIISEVDGVAAVLVKGELNAEWGETVVAYLVANPSVEHQSLIETVRSAVAAKLARYKVPRKFFIVDRLPPG